MKIVTSPSNQDRRKRVEELRAEIARHPFMHGFSEAQIATMADYAMEVQFSPGQLLFREGEMANRFYLLLEGEVTLEGRGNGHPAAVGVVGANEVLGWSWLFPPYCWHFAARATKPTRAIFFYGTWLREHCDSNPALGYELIKRMAAVVIQRLQTTREKLSATLAEARQE